MEANEIDWQTLERLRTRFISSSPSSAAGAYWQSEHDLEQYHATFAARIGWKWDNALGAATQAGFTLRARKLLDWGCGSGIATLRALAHFGPDAIDEVLLWDHSLAACRFAQKTILEAFPDLTVEIAPPPNDSSPSALADTAVLVSHALNELTPEMEASLTQQIREAAQILFVEAGDYQTSRLLIKQREALRDRFHISAPCTRCGHCPVLEPENASHWCHFFGKPPIEAFTEGYWARFAQTMEIDLRSLPYSFLALTNKQLGPIDTPPGDTASRLIGRPRQFKGYTRLLSCDDHGLRELELQKRDDKRLWKTLKKGPTETLFHWSRIEADRIKSGESI